MEQRNPFRIRKSEQIGTASTFHRLFGPHMTKMLEENRDYLWDRLQIMRSAPGGGKTSLLRLFTTESLLAIHGYNNMPEYKSLYDAVQSLGAINENGPAVLGVLTNCELSYAKIEYLNIDDTDKQKIFLALLNTRVLLGILESICAFYESNYPDDLDKIEIVPSLAIQTDFKEFFSCFNGKELFNSARDIERDLCAIINSVGKVNLNGCPGTSELLVWKAFGEGAIHYDGQIAPVKTLIMLDDIHELSFNQRKLLLRALEQKYPAVCWAAERYDALSNSQVIFDGSTQGREYNDYRIEEWASSNKTNKAFFQKGLGYIADQRVQEAKTIEVSDFEPLLEALERKKNITQKCNKAMQTVSERIQKTILKEKRFKPWVDQLDLSNKSVLEQAVEWRTLEILINRKRKRDIPTLFPDLELPSEEYDKMNSSGVKNAAKLFIASEFKIPYYHGLDSLKALSSGNIEQFLEISGDIFEEILAVRTLKPRERKISAERQEAIIRKAAKNRLEDIPRRMPYGTDVYNFILQIGQLARKKTYEDTSPYAPGVTGIAISQNDLRKLSDDNFIKKNPKYERLALVLREAIAKNILETRSGQQCKGQEWFVLYLNRLLCAHFWLPLEYGGWKEQSLKTLLQWVSEPTLENFLQEELLLHE